jgi:copper chaperone CopZ
MSKQIIFFLYFTCLSNITLAGFEKLEIKIIGLTCSMCSYSVENAIKKLPYVDKIEMELNSNIASVYIKKMASPDIMEIVNKVYEAGFSVKETFAYYTFTESQIINGVLTEEPYSFTFISNEKSIVEGFVKLRILNKKCIPNKEYKKLNKEHQNINNKSFTYLVSIEP